MGPPTDFRTEWRKAREALKRSLTNRDYVLGNPPRTRYGRGTMPGVTWVGAAEGRPVAVSVRLSNHPEWSRRRALLTDWIMRESTGQSELFSPPPDGSPWAKARARRVKWVSRWIKAGGWRLLVMGGRGSDGKTWQWWAAWVGPNGEALPEFELSRPRGRPKKLV